ncbi:MAG: four helix bundle protein [Muribaculum sp.]|nr:four helix bundle protein [Muribaculum sp.]
MGNAVVDKSLDFAVRIVNLHSFLRDDKHEYVMSKQLLRSGTSIGANIAESQYAQSTPDFLSKLYVALKECSETRYWLKLLSRTKLLSPQEFESMENDASELYALLTSIIKSTKSNNSKF